MRGLALDGGGVKGVAQAKILSKAQPGATDFDFVAGTSIGSVCAAYAAGKQDLSTLMNFFYFYAPKIFAGRWWRKLKPFGPRYNDTELNKALRDVFHGYFGDLKTPTFITAADLNRQRLKVFSSIDSDDAKWPLWEVIRCAVAAESYFTPWKGYADGGIIANNPAMVAITSACKELGATDLSDISLYSIGAGSAVFNAPVSSTKSWTKIKWGVWILDALLDGFTVTMHDTFASSLPLKKYHRVQFYEPEDWAMDDTATINKCLKAWKLKIQNAIISLNNF